MIRIIASLLGLSVVLGSAWLLSEHVNDLNDQIVRQDSAEVKKAEEFKSALRDAAAAKDSAIADRDRVAKSYDELQVELKSEVAGVTADRDKALRQAAELQTKLTAAMAAKSKADDTTLPTHGSSGFDPVRYEQRDLSKDLDNLQERYDILDTRLTRKDEELSELRDDLNRSNSIVGDLNRIEELKRDLMVLPSSINITLPSNVSGVSDKKERSLSIIEGTVRTTPGARSRSLSVIAPMHKPAAKIANKIVPTFVRHTRDETMHRSTFGMPSGLPSELRPIEY